MRRAPEAPLTGIHLPAEVAAPGQACCNKRIRTPRPERCCGKVAIESFDPYIELHDCDDAFGYMASDQMVGIRKRSFRFIAMTNEYREGYDTVEYNPVGGWTIDPASGSVKGAHWHDGRCTCIVTSDIIDETVYLWTLAVVSCTGGTRNHHLLEQWFGDF